MSDLTSRAFWAATAERAVKTVAQTWAALLLAGTSAVDLLHIAWQQSLGVAAGAGLISVLTSIGSASITSSPGPSLTNAEVLVPPAPPAPGPPNP